MEMEIKRKFKKIIQLVTRSIWNLLTDLTHNMHWLRSKLQTTYCTDLSLSALINGRQVNKWRFPADKF